MRSSRCVRRLSAVGRGSGRPRLAGTQADYVIAASEGEGDYLRSLLRAHSLDDRAAAVAVFSVSYPVTLAPAAAQAGDRRSIVFVGSFPWVSGAGCHSAVTQYAGAILVALLCAAHRCHV